MWKDAGEKVGDCQARFSLVVARPLSIKWPIAYKPRQFLPYVLPLPVNQTQSCAILAQSFSLSTPVIIRTYIDYKVLTQANASHHAYTLR